MTGFELTVACLALNIYHESSNEPPAGMQAVAFVTVHRMRESDTDSCDVVFKRRQFSWANKALDDHGKLKPQYMPSGERWRESRKVARAILGNEVQDFTQGATHYHAAYINQPRWARKMKYLGKWGTHLFYRRVM